MAFPTFHGVAANRSAYGIDTHVCSMPGGIVSGDLLLAFVTSYTGGSAFTMFVPTGYTNIYNQITDGNRHYASCFARTATGTGDGCTVTCSSTSPEFIGSVVWRISGQNGGTLASIIAHTTAVQGQVNPDTGNLSPSWGLDDTLWISGFGQMGTTEVHSPTTIPSGFGNLASSSATNAGVIAASHRLLNAASLDPTNYGDYSWGTKAISTLAVRPASITGSPAFPSHISRQMQAILTM